MHARTIFAGLILEAGVAWAGPATHTSEPEDVATNAIAYNGYTRTKLPDGKFKPEHFAFAEGMRWDAGGPADNSIDNLSFKQIAATIAGPLAAQGYVAATDPKQTDLLILVFWGMTEGSRQLEADTVFRNAIDSRNGYILGYAEEYERQDWLRKSGHQTTHDTFFEIGSNRYFVVLKAYDFRYAQKQKKLKILWETRFSIYAQGNRFDDQLLAMTQVASKYFGQNTRGLVRSDLPEGKVDVGAPTVVETPSGEKKR